MTPSLAAAASGDLRAFEGAQIAGVIPLREHILDEGLRQAVTSRRGRVQDIELRIGANNLVECGVRIAVGPFAKWFRPQMILSPQVMTPYGPRVTLTMASNNYAGLMWIAQVFANEFFPRGLTIDGRQIVVDIAALPQALPVRPVLQSLRRLTMRTAPGVLHIDFELKVGEQ